MSVDVAWCCVIQSDTLLTETFNFLHPKATFLTFPPSRTDITLSPFQSQVGRNNEAMPVKSKQWNSGTAALKIQEHSHHLPVVR